MQSTDVPEDIELGEIRHGRLSCPQFAQDRFNQATKAFLLCDLRMDNVPRFHRGWSVV